MGVGLSRRARGSSERAGGGGQRILSFGHFAARQPSLAGTRRTCGKGTKSPQTSYLWMPCPRKPHVPHTRTGYGGSGSAYPSSRPGQELGTTGWCALWSRGKLRAGALRHRCGPMGGGRPALALAGLGEQSCLHCD